MRCSIPVLATELGSSAEGYLLLTTESPLQPKAVSSNLALFTSSSFLFKVQKDRKPVTPASESWKQEEGSEEFNGNLGCVASLAWVTEDFVPKKQKNKQEAKNFRSF